MFEQTLLRPAPARGWAVILGFAGELALVGGVLAVPMIWPQLLPRVKMMTWISAPAPPPAVKEAPVPQVRPTRPWTRSDALWYRPVSTQPFLLTLDAPPPPSSGVTGGSESNPPSNGFGPIFSAVIEPPGRPVEVAAPSPKPPPSPVQQVRVSGAVQAARLIHRIDVVYPALARQIRLAGTVELTGVIDTSGHIRELRVVSGHPILVPAALDAVRQWIYQPTLLGGEPVEVITTISVVFRLLN